MRKLGYWGFIISYNGHSTFQLFTRLNNCPNSWNILKLNFMLTCTFEWHLLCLLPQYSQNQWEDHCTFVLNKTGRKCFPPEPLSGPPESTNPIFVTYHCFILLMLRLLLIVCPSCHAPSFFINIDYNCPAPSGGLTYRARHTHGDKRPLKVPPAALPWRRERTNAASVFAKHLYD